MPWVKEDMCTGCGLCVAECPVDAIHQGDDGIASIDEAECIRCGRCHDVCPQEAVRHDGERIPQEVADNLRWVRKLLVHFPTPQERSAFMDRMVRYFNKQVKVSEQTRAAVAAAQDRPVEAIDLAIESLSEADTAQTGGRRPA